MNFDSVSRDDWILAGVALLLVINLLFLPWFSISFGPISATLTGNRRPGWRFGILAVLSAVALIADLGVERLSPGTALPNIGGSRTQTRFVLACVTALFVALKFVFNIHFSDFGFGFYAAVVLTAGLVWVALQARSERVGGAATSTSGARVRAVAAAEWCSCHAFAAARSSPPLSAVVLVALMFLVPWLSFANPGGGHTERRRVDEPSRRCGG